MNARLTDIAYLLKILAVLGNVCVTQKKVLSLYLLIIIVAFMMSLFSAACVIINACEFLASFTRPLFEEERPGIEASEFYSRHGSAATPTLSALYLELAAYKWMFSWW